MDRRRVVVTGEGAVTPLGVSVDRLWDGLIDARSGIGEVTLFDASEYAVRIGGECTDFVPAEHIDRKIIKRMDRFAQLAVVACDEALASSGMELAKVDRKRMGVVFGSGIGGINELEQQFSRLLQKGPSKVSVFTIPKLMVNAASGNISIRFGAKGISTAVSTACASATNAMGEALRIIRQGDADVVFTGGSEAAMTRLTLAAFASMKALSTRTGDPHLASRPFDRDRSGFVLGEGAGALIFEALEHAERRGAPILAEIVGFGTTCDALHITQPCENGTGAAESMRIALADARIAAADVDYINAHGTGTPLGDLAEIVAIRSVFGPAADKVVVSSTKSSIGHLLGASGAVELIACIRAIRNGVIPPTINLDNPGEGCDLDFCPNTARDMKVRVTMSNSFGFGGHNACIIARRFER